MRIILISLVCLFSCSKPNIDLPTLKSNNVEEWHIIEDCIKENWNKEKLLNVLGKPKEIWRFKGDTHDSYLYHDDRTGFQSWAFGFDEKNLISDVTYMPSSKGESMFMNSLRKRWAHLKCFEKTDPSKIPHVVMNHRYLSCENGKRKAYYNMYEEVESISVSRLK